MAAAETIIGVSAIAATIMTVVVTGARVYLRKLEIEHGSGRAAVPRGMDERLQRIENAVEAIAVEVERVSEGQRFTTKLLADRSPAAPSGQG